MTMIMITIIIIVIIIMMIMIMIMIMIIIIMIIIIPKKLQEVSLLKYIMPVPGYNKPIVLPKCLPHLPVSCQ